MTAKDTLRGTQEHPTKDEPAYRGQDGCEAAHDDSRTASQNNPPHHDLPTNGVNAFLWWLHEGTPLEEDVLAEKYAYFEQTTAEDRRDDPSPSWRDSGLAEFGGGNA